MAAGSIGKSAGYAASTPSGTATFKDDNALLGSADLARCVASLSTAELGPGVHHLSANLDGQQAATNTTAPPVVVVAQKAGTIIPVLVLHNFNHTSGCDAPFEGAVVAHESRFWDIRPEAGSHLRWRRRPPHSARTSYSMPW